MFLSVFDVVWLFLWFVNVDELISANIEEEVWWWVFVIYFVVIV